VTDLELSGQQGQRFLFIKRTNGFIEQQLIGERSASKNKPAQCVQFFRGNAIGIAI